MPKKSGKKNIAKHQKEQQKKQNKKPKPSKSDEPISNKNDDNTENLDTIEHKNNEQDQQKNKEISQSGLKDTLPLSKRELLDKWGIKFGPPGYVPAPAGTPKSVHVSDFTMFDPAGGRELLSKTDIHVSEGHIYGLVGKNGFGKSTLLKQMAKYEIEGYPNHIRMILVNQEEELSNMTVVESVLKADEIRQNLVENEEKLNKMLENEEDGAEIDEKKQDEINEILQIIWDIMEDFNYNQSEKQAMQILTGLGFTKEMMKKSTKDLSGGWQMRVKLAKALFVEPDLMLLDEPTNHLDFPTVLWLQDYLKNYKKTVLLVSHDRAFLNEVCTHIILLSQKKLTNYKGNYDTMLKTQKVQFVEQNSSYEAKVREIKEIKEWISKYKEKGDKMAAQVKSKAIVLEKLEEEAELLKPPEVEKTLTFTFPDIGTINDYICRMTNVKFKYSDMATWLLNNISFQLDMDSRIGMIGANGVGKTTLVKLIMGIIEPSEGECLRNRQARISLFTQYHMDQLDLELNAIDFVQKRFAEDPELKEEKDKVSYIRRRLGRFNLTGKQHTQPMKYLSGGQKSRVAFCISTWYKPHFLIMDEPTNHLDMETIDSLIAAVKEFHGGVLIISHDQFFLSQVASLYWAVTPEKIRMFEEFENAKKFALSERLLEIGKNEEESD